MSEAKFLVITGISGSGKSLVHNALEDLGYYCVDNLPIRLMSKFFELIEETSREVKRVAVVTDVREPSFLTEFVRVFLELKARFSVELLFLEASDEVLLQRFSETRRPHPLASQCSLPEAIRSEREKLAAIRDLADHVVDTSRFNVHQVGEFIRGKFGPESGAQPLVVSLESFGFKHGVPREVDLLFDVRFLPNPYFQAGLRDKTGKDDEVIGFLRSNPDFRELIRRLVDLLDYLMPKYVKEGKSYLTIGIGCTGGKHRSVVVASELAAALSQRNDAVSVRHRDISRP